MQLWFKKYHLHIDQKDLKPSQESGSESVVKLPNKNVYRIFPLPFGGFLAFDPENVICYRKNIRHTLITKKLRKIMRINSICPMD
jgi:hypothetical protein